MPSHPDVPQVPEVEVEPLVAEAMPAGGAELARIATFLREEREDEDDEPSLDDRPDGFDIPAVLRAVQGVAGVREATLRKNADGLHTLRLELLDEADPGRVSRAVARLLNERMGLAAEPNLPEPADLTPMAPRVPGQPARGNAPHSALPGYGREARRRRPVSGVRRPAEAPRPDLDELRQPPGLLPRTEPAETGTQHHPQALEAQAPIDRAGPRARDGSEAARWSADGHGDGSAARPGARAGVQPDVRPAAAGPRQPGGAAGPGAAVQFDRVAARDHRPGRGQHAGRRRGRRGAAERRTGTRGRPGERAGGRRLHAAARPPPPPPAPSTSC